MAEEENEAPETAPENTAEPAESSSEIGANRFLVKERYEIDYAQPLPWLDSNGAKAFRVIDRIDTKRGLFALLCSNATCPRSTILPYVKSIECRSLMKLVEFGIVTWLPEKSRNLALIYKIPYGKVFEGGKTELDIRSSEKFKNTLISLLSAVEALKTTTLPIAPSAPTTFIMPTPKKPKSSSATVPLLFRPSTSRPLTKRSKTCCPYRKAAATAAKKTTFMLSAPS